MTLVRGQVMYRPQSGAAKTLMRVGQAEAYSQSSSPLVPPCVGRRRPTREHVLWGNRAARRQECFQALRELIRIGPVLSIRNQVEHHGSRAGGLLQESEHAFSGFFPLAGVARTLIEHHVVSRDRHVIQNMTNGHLLIDVDEIDLSIL